ncbi:helix-turn-helix transcriptional regulator [Amycolatopsis endophytica]|nr:helix-turn-helix transcriptional regulator [Amycolatopsis endophytica]
MQRPVGEQLRQWRERRRLSQLDLALAAEISARHLSFLENGRSHPSRDMVLRLGERLDVPLRERNRMLLAAGFAPVYPEHALTDLGAALEAIRHLLAGHEPYPAVVVDRGWDLVEANSGLALLTARVDPELLEPPVNVLRVALHPRGLAPHVLNLGQWRAELLGRLRRQVEITADADLADLLTEVRGYPCDQPETEMPPGSVFVPLRLRHGDGELRLMTTVATFGTPLDVTLAELVIESFYPADAATRAVLTRPTPT